MGRPPRMVSNVVDTAPELDNEDADLVPLMGGPVGGESGASSTTAAKLERPVGSSDAEQVAQSWRKHMFLPAMAVGFAILAVRTLGTSRVFGMGQQPSMLEQVQNLQQRFVQSQEELYTLLKDDYGEENFRRLFLQDVADGEDGEEASPTVPTRGRSSFVGGENGWNGMKRKITIKLLQALHQPPKPSTQPAVETDGPVVDSGVPFVWATGGHSAAAGHGNWFNQSYTAYMERAVAPLFANLGLHLVARNYAVGGATSGPEIALCQEARFGNDVDVLTWDFGMTDGDYFHRMELYYYRAALSATRPAAIGFPRGEYTQRIDILNALGDLGMTTLYMNETEFRAVLELVPDTLGKSQDELEAMPPFVRNFKCDNQIEDGDPYCGEEKYTLQVCPDRRFKTSWHPGWKWQALNGNLMGLFLVEIIQDALRELQLAVQENPNLNTVALLANLTAQEAADYQNIVAAELPTYSQEYHRDDPADQAQEFRHVYYKEPTICHIALLPSEIRFKGILTESEPVEMLQLPDGLLDTQAYDAPVSESDEALRLVGDADTRQKCIVPLNQDHRDHFYVSNREGWRHLTLPNDAELKEYGTQPPTPLKGMIAICYVGCPWDQCEEGDMRFNSTGHGPVEIQVNGVPVKSLREIDKPCHLLENAKTGHLWKANEDGRFRISARVTRKESYLRFSSFILW